MSKSEADWCKKIEIWWLLRDIKAKGGYKYTTVSWGENGSRGSISIQVSVCNEEKYARFIYTQTDSVTGEKKNFDYKVPIIETPCHLGGTRYWFKCSLYKSGQYCGRRVGVLYKNGDWFGCRHCYDLTYSSRKANKKYRYYPMFRVLELDAEIEKAYKKAKRYTYRGNPTKKRKKIEKLSEEAMHYYQRFSEIKDKI
ncbi:MAG: hypothetical protein EOM85_03515 [Candidatus Moranbacteria bacterium]|nr:hypothetical protein [Candidatus Moranbacteria bacterium]